MVRSTSWAGSKLSDSWNEHNGMCVCVFVCVCVRERESKNLSLPIAFTNVSWIVHARKLIQNQKNDRSYIKVHVYCIVRLDHYVLGAICLVSNHFSLVLVRDAGSTRS